jgi:hypothetical protein
MTQQLVCGPGSLHYQDQTQTHIKKTSLDERSDRARDLYLTTQHSQHTDIHAHGGIRHAVTGIELQQTHAEDRAVTGDRPPKFISLLNGSLASMLLKNIEYQFKQTRNHYI